MANLFVNFPTFQEPPMPPTDTINQLSLRFDFSHYDITGTSKSVTLPNAQCLKGSFVIVVEADGLSVGRSYTIQFELLNPSSTRQVFDPQTIQIFASSVKQQFTTLANVDPQYSYILKATIQQTDTLLSASDMVAVSCENIPILPTPTPTPTAIPNLKILFDDGPIMEVKAPNRCSEQLNIIATLNNARVGKTYKYDFIVLTENTSVTVSPNFGYITAGYGEQNINTIVSILENDGSLLSLQLKIYDAQYPDVILDEDILLIQCYECK
jgi:hypothetical protein